MKDVTRHRAAGHHSKSSTEWLMVFTTPAIRQPITLNPNGDQMNLSKTINALAGIKKAKSNPAHAEPDVFLRYTDTMGASQTVPIGDIIEEVPHGDENTVRRVILVAVSK